MKRSASKPQKPLAEIKKPLRAKAFRAKFRALETTKYLNVKALKSAKHVTIEVGTLEFAGMSQPISAEIRSGMIVALKPTGCDCRGMKDSKDSKQRPAKFSTAAVTETIQLMGAALRQGGHNPPAPAPVEVSARLGIRIPIGPIVIVLGEPPYGIDICIVVVIGRIYCWSCFFGGSNCIILQDWDFPI